MFGSNEALVIEIFFLSYPTVQLAFSHTMNLDVQVMQLRKACSHPYLFDGVEPEPFQEGEHIVEVSYLSFL